MQSTVKRRGPYKTWQLTGQIPRSTRYARLAACDGLSDSNFKSKRRKKCESSKCVRQMSIGSVQESFNVCEGEQAASENCLSVDSHLPNETSNEAIMTSLCSASSQQDETCTMDEDSDHDETCTMDEDSDHDEMSEAEEGSADEMSPENVVADFLDEEEPFTHQSDHSDDEVQEAVKDVTPNDSSDESEPEEDLCMAPNFDLPINDKIKMLLILATKRRHGLTYTAAQDIMELSGVLSQDDDPFLPSKSKMKRAIDSYSFSLSEHQVCPDCGEYIGVVTSEYFDCESCDKSFNTADNRRAGNFFMYLPLYDQIKALLETCLSEDDFINPQHRDKINRFNYEDIFDGKMYKNNYLPDQLSFNFFVDGVPVATTNRKKSCWPCLCTINELRMPARRKYVLMACLWLSKKKPNCNQYLKPFVEECIVLAARGITYKRNGVTRTVKVKACCCISDSIARPLLRNSTQFNGRYGCGFCYHPGIRMVQGRGHTRSYTTKDASFPIRTHEELMRHAARAEIAGESRRGIKGKSVLCNLPDFDMVWSVDLDLFHALVNVSKRFTNLWFKKKRRNVPAYNIYNQMAEVDRRLLSIKPTCNVSRAPRSLEDRSDYRGHEWFHWVVVYSVPVLRKILPPRYLNHWAHLVSGIVAVMQNSITKSELAYAERSINAFVTGIDDLYGAQNVTFSVHLLTHLTKSIQNFSQPWAHSAFIYESFNGEIKNCIRSSNGVAQQITKAMQLKVAVSKMESDLKDSFTEKQVEYLDKVMSTTERLVPPHLFIESAGLLGKPKESLLSKDSVAAITLFGGECNAHTIASIYDRCLLGGEVYHSSGYSKVSKQINSLVRLESNDIFFINSFVVISNQCYVLGYYYTEHRNVKLCDVKLPHFLLLKDNHEGRLRCISLSQICSKLLFLDLKTIHDDCINVGCIYVLESEMLR